MLPSASSISSAASSEPGGYRPRVEVDGERIFSHRLVDVSWSRK